VGGAVGSREDGGVGDRHDGGGVGRRSWSVGKRREVKEAKEGKEREARAGCVARGWNSHCAPPRLASPDETLPGLTPVKSSDMPSTLIEPFKAVPSKVPENVTSVAPWSRTMLIVKLNLSALR